MKRAFTLYEIAIVLVIVGLIAAMLIKGASIIRVAEFKQEGLKVEKIRYALATFEKRNGRLPGDEANVGIIDRGLSVRGRQELIDSGFITDSDFKTNFDMESKVKPAIWDFRRCVPQTDGTYRVFTNATNDPGLIDNESPVIGAHRGHLCVIFCRIYDDGIAYADMPYDVLKRSCSADNDSTKSTPKGVVGGYEIYFDDGTIGGGFGRIANAAAEDNLSITDTKKNQREMLRDYFAGDVKKPLFRNYYVIRVWP